MTYVFHFVVCLCLLIIQTTLLPVFPLLNNFYDLCIPFVIFLGLMRPFRESILTIVLLGITVDNLSGSPLFLYVTVYLWLVCIVQVILKVAQVGTHLRLMTLVTFGVLFENLMLTGFLIIVEPGVKITYSQITSLILQLIWAALTGSILVVTFEKLYMETAERVGKFLVEHTNRSSSHTLDS